jgi:hypothetical protein
MNELFILLKLTYFQHGKSSFYNNISNHISDEKNIDLLWMFFKLICLSDFTPENLKLMFNRKVKYSYIARRLGIPASTYRSQASRFSQKIYKIWPKGTVEKLLTSSIDSVEHKKLTLLLIIYLSRHRLTSNTAVVEEQILINVLHEVVPRYHADITDEDFQHISKYMAYLSQENQYILWNNLSKKQKEYALYLLLNRPFNFYTTERDYSYRLLSTMGIKNTDSY